MASCRKFCLDKQRGCLRTAEKQPPGGEIPPQSLPDAPSNPPTSAEIAVPSEVSFVQVSRRDRSVASCGGGHVSA